MGQRRDSAPIRSQRRDERDREGRALIRSADTARTMSRERAGERGKAGAQKRAARAPGVPPNVSGYFRETNNTYDMELYIRYRSPVLSRRDNSRVRSLSLFRPPLSLLFYLSPSARAALGRLVGPSLFHVRAQDAATAVEIRSHCPREERYRRIDEQ